MKIITLKDLALKNKRVIIREDLNVPIKRGCITSDSRIRAALPSIEYALSQGAAVILLSHLGRPQEGKIDPNLSLKRVAERLQQLLHHPVRFIPDWINGFKISPGEVVLCENVRFQIGEKENDKKLAKKIAALGDIFVMDAFATAHRSEASTVGVTQYIQQACAGFLLLKEVEALSQALKDPVRPLLAIVGGAKVSSKLHVLHSLLKKVNVLILGGGIANTFLAAQGIPIGRSLIEESLIGEARQLIELAKKNNVQLILPIDVVVANEKTDEAKSHIKKINEIAENEMILDSGPETIKQYLQVIHEAKTILWNGPIGVFEIPSFSNGTRELSLAIANSKAFSVAGGGDTLAAIEKFNIADQISYISTGGGAFLEFIEGKNLPALEALLQRGKHEKT